MNWTLAGLILIPIAIGAGQLLFKLSSQTAGPLSVPGIFSLFTNPWFVLALALYGVSTIAWVYVLRGVDVSRAYQFMALTYLAVPVGAWLIFDEAISGKQLMGMLIIALGVVVTNS